MQGSAASVARWEADQLTLGKRGFADGESINSSGGLAGYTDWRLPNIKELTSIVELKCTALSINSTTFPKQPFSCVWSDSAYTGNSTGACLVEFDYNGDINNPRTSPYYVRLVRGSQ